MSEQRIVDADCHYIEPKTMWEDWLPAKFRDQAPRLVPDGRGGDAWAHPFAPNPSPIGIITTPGFAYDDIRGAGVSYDQIRPGCYDGNARLKDMDADGVAIELVSGPQNTMSHFMASPDDDYLLAGFRACNDFLIDGFCAADPSRLAPLPQVPSLDIDVALHFLERLVARGARGVLLSGWPSGGTSISIDDDPFWAAASEARMPVCVHIQMVAASFRRAQRSNFHGIGEARSPSPIGRAIAVGDLGIVFQNVPKVVNQFIFSGAFDRFPGLQVVLLEAGVGWIPHCIEQLDDRYWRLRRWGDVQLQQPPSHYWHRNMAANIIRDPVGVALRHHVGTANIMWSSDYPHHVTDWPYSRKVIGELLGAIPSSERRAIISENAIRIFHLPSPISHLSWDLQAGPT